MPVNINVRWADNTKELQAALRAGTTEINATRQSVTKMVEAFQGDKLIAFAHKATAAINEVGAVTLTASEAARNLNLLEKAMEKLSLTSKPIPEDMARTAAELRDVVDAAKKAETGTSGLIGQFTTLVGALQVNNLIERGTRALVDFAKEAIATAGRLVDLSAKTGLTTETIQRMEFAGKQTGVSLESFADAAFRLGTRLSGGSGSVRNAVSELGLSFEALKNQTPDEQFNTVVKALESMTDSTERNRIGVELFGKSFSSIAAAVAGGYSEMAAQAKVASDDQLKALDHASDAWDAFVARQKTAITGFLGNLVIESQTIGKMTSEQLAKFQDLRTRGEFAAAQAFALDIAKKLAAQHDINLPKEKQQIDYAIAYSQALKAAKAEVDSLTAEERREIAAAEQLGKSHDEIADRFGLSEGALKLLNEQIHEGVKASREHESELKKAAAAAERMEEAAKKLQTALDKFTHDSIMDSIKALKDWGDEGKRQLKIQIDEFIKTNEAAEKLRNTLHALQRDDFTGVTQGLENVGTKVPVLSEAQQEAIKAGDATGRWVHTLDAAAQMLEEVGRASTGAFRLVSSGLAAVSRSLANVIAAQRAYTAGKGSVLELGGAYLSMFTTVIAIGHAIDEASLAAERLKLARDVVRKLGSDFQFATTQSESLNQSLLDTIKLLTEAGSRRRSAAGSTVTTGSAVARPLSATGTAQAQAEALLINEIIAQAGGLAMMTADQLARVQARIGELFGLIKQGGFIGAKALTALDDVLADMGANAKRTNGLVSQFFIDTVAKARAAGIELEKVNAFLLEQTQTKVVGGLAAFTAGGTDARKNLEDVRKAMADIKAERDDLMRRPALGASDAKRLEELNKQWADLEKKAKSAEAVIAAGTVTSQSAATALGSSVLAAFEEMRRQGVPILDIMDKLSPIIEELQKKFEAAGFTGGAAFDAVREMATLAKDEVAGPVIAGINGLGQALMGLHNIGALDQDTFLGLTRQIKDGYNALVAQGKGGTAALRLMQPTLQTIWALHKDTGMAIDEETQKLLDEAEAAGIVGDKQRPIQEQMLLATNKIADAVEYLAEVFGKLPDAAADAADGISDGLSKIKVPKVKVPIEWLPPNDWPVPGGGPTPNPTPFPGNATTNVPAFRAPSLTVPVPFPGSESSRAGVVSVTNGNTTVYLTAYVYPPEGTDVGDMEAFAPAFKEALRLDTGSMRTAVEGLVQKKVEDLTNAG